MEIYLHIIKPFEELKNEDLSDLWNHRSFFFSQIFQHNVQRSRQEFHNYVQEVILSHSKTT